VGSENSIAGDVLRDPVRTLAPRPRRGPDILNIAGIQKGGRSGEGSILCGGWPLAALPLLSIHTTVIPTATI